MEKKYPQAFLSHFPLSKELLRISPQSIQKTFFKVIILPTWVIHATIKAQLPTKDDYMLKRWLHAKKTFDCKILSNSELAYGREPMNPLRENVFSSFPEIVCSQFGRGKYLDFTVWGTSPWSKNSSCQNPKTGALIHSLSVGDRSIPTPDGAPALWSLATATAACFWNKRPF